MPTEPPDPSIEPSIEPSTDLLSPAAALADQLLRKLTKAMGSNGEDRPGQHEMTRAIADAVDQERHVVVAAGTGTGKSLAYLAAAVALRKRVVVATATKALQDQLDTKELPFLAAQLGRPLSWAVLKGRSNYLCRQRLDEVETAGSQLGLEGLASVPEQELSTLRDWAEETTTGDRAELEREPRAATWAALSVGPRECPGANNCPKGDECFAERARAKARDADVVIVNAHLYSLHLAADRAVLPDHDVLVVDEAHELADIVTSTTGVVLSASRFNSAARTVGSLVESDEIVEGLETAGRRMGETLRDHEGRLRRGLPADVAESVTTARVRLNASLEALRKVDDSLGADVATRKARVTNAVTALVTDIDAFVSPRADDVMWVDELAGEHRLQVAPLDVGLTLDRLLWDPPDRGGLEIAAAGPADPEDDPRYGLPTSVVLTSATIPVGLARQLHLDPAITDELDVGTPFDFETQGLLYCAAHLPDPRKEQYADAMLEELAALIDAAGGRTLALFTSHRMLRLAAERLRDEIAYEVLVQGDRPKPALIEAFATDESSCLFATMGYWQGIDVPGAALSLVTIDRIPFPRPDEPIWQARREAAGATAFRTIDVPRAATLLAQGAGRLIRNGTDRGVVAVLDPRLATNKSYRWELVSALPPMRRTRDRADVAKFLGERE